MAPIESAQRGTSYINWTTSTGYEFSATDPAKDDNAKNPWSCPHCLKGFTRSDSLQRHLDTHEGAKKKKFACAFCTRGSKAFARKDHLNQHLRDVHKYTTFQCPVNGCLQVGLHGWFSKHRRQVHQQDAHGDLRGQELAAMNAEIDAKVAKSVPGSKKQ